MGENILTPEAKNQIRVYMLNLVTLPAIIASIIIFVLGYLINEVASERAFHEAYKEASNTVLELIQQTTLAAHDATIAKQNIEKIRAELQEISLEAKGIRGKLKTAQAFQSSEDIVNAVADSLATRKDFKDNIIGLTEEKLTEISNRINETQNRLSGIRLQVIGTSVSKLFACGEEQKTNSKDLLFMYGSRDGTSCGVHNVNYYKEIGLYIPPQ